MNQLATRPGTALRLTEASYLDALEHPLTVLPAQMRSAVFKLWVSHRFIKDLESSLPITATLAIWIEDWGLHPDDAETICKRLTNPIRMAKHKWASDLITDMAEEAEKLMQIRAKKEADKPKLPEPFTPADEQTQAELKAMLASFGLPIPKDDIGNKPNEPKNSR